MSMNVRGVQLPITLFLAGCLLSAVARGSAAPAAAVGSPATSPLSMGAVRPGNRVLPQIAVIGFGAKGGETGQVGRIIGDDLSLADVASPADPATVGKLASDDLAREGLDYDRWAAAGVLYVLKGAPGANGDQAELYDVASKTRVMGKAYATASADVRRLAHRIADDVLQAMTGRPGLFSSRICWVSGGKNKDVYVGDADGGSVARLTNEGSIVANPCWGKNGTEVYFTSYRDNNPDLYGMTLDGRRWNISRRPGQNASANWSEAVQKIVLSLSKDGNSEVYSMNRDGRGLARLTNNTNEADTAPAWSPDGGQIAFTSDRGGTPAIYIMSASGGNQRKVSSGGYADSPTWSPDGQRLAYAVREGGDFNIHVLEIATGQTSVVARGGGNVDPTWGPSSRHLVYSSTRGGGRQLYMLNIDTRNSKPIPNTNGGQQPSWGPLYK